ncbi:MAG: hypothetical protein N2167_11170, partial [Flavobacteriales bacterium]|nr:hypothetical protein [Flavobacteriales bacterium]
MLSSEDSSIYLLVNYQENSYDVNTMVIKLRSNGEEIWRRKYGGGSHSEIPQCMTWMPDGSILIGSSKSNFAHVPILTPELYPTWLFRIDTAGQLLNQWTNPNPMSWFPGAMAPTPDGGIVFAGAYTEYHSNGQAMIVNSITKHRNDWEIDWDLKLNSTAGFNFIENLTLHNNYIYACGYEFDSTSIHNGTNEIPLQTQYGVLYKINLNGEIIFKHYYSVPLPFSEFQGLNSPIPIIYSLNIPNDSTLLMAGELRVSFSPPQPTSTQYGWLIKTNLQGCICLLYTS